jgi:hypothetical protein
MSNEKKIKKIKKITIIIKGSFFPVENHFPLLSQIGYNVDDRFIPATFCFLANKAGGPLPFFCSARCSLLYFFRNILSAC